MRIGLVFLIVLVVLGSFLSYKTLTVKGVCGWEEGKWGIKKWDCRCIGFKRQEVNENFLLLSGSEKIYLCSGLNLSCSDFGLEYFYKDVEEKPDSCERG